MKKQHFPLVLIILVGIIAWIPLQSKAKRTRNKAADEPAYAEQQRPQPLMSPGTPPSNRRAEGAVRNYVSNKLVDPEYDWKQSINFYGRVIDEDEQPVRKAVVNFKWNDLSPDGTSTTQTESDASGFFSLINRTGKYLTVQVAKEGYYTSRQSPVGFEYANPANGLVTPDPSNPVIFHLRKKGLGVPLVTSAYGMRTSFPISIPRDGTPLLVDLMIRKTGSAGQMQVSQEKPEYTEWKQATNWSFRMEIPDGGFVEQNDEFPFKAPENGYEPVVEFNFEKGTGDWVQHIKKSYYLKFGSPPRYGRLQIETGISYGGAILTYAINPDGSRNLEAK